MSPIDALAQEKVTEYLTDFASALSAYLRPYAGKLGPQWLGLDRAKRSMLLRWSAEGFSAFVVDSWIGKPVVGSFDPDGGVRIRKRFDDIPKGKGDQTFVAVAMKEIRPSANGGISLAGDYTFEVSLNQAGALAAIGPQCLTGLTQDEAKTMAVRKRPDLPVALLQRRAAPPWTVAFLSRGHPDTLLDGFDPDPVLFARSVADTILNIEGLQDDPVKRYANASEQLREAVKALGSKNERDLHSLIESMPWILLPEGEFESFDSKKALVFEERLSDGGKQRSTIVPDFLYRQFEHDTLVVEIESGTKRLLTTKQQTNLSLPSAKAVASMFQILSYFRVLSGPMSVLPRQELDVPDDWAFRFLLVVGSRLQKDFDERSWMALRDYLHAAGIVLRTWDYYIDRLERLSRMADFKRS